MEKISRLYYPQYTYRKDRRQQDIPVEFDRRSGVDRRSENRVCLDTQLTKDIFEVKKKIAELDVISPKFCARKEIQENASTSPLNAPAQDEFIKISKPDSSAQARAEAQQQSRIFDAILLTSALSSMLVVSFLGSAGAVIAIGTGVYVGGRVLKNTILNHVKTSKVKEE